MWHYQSQGQIIQSAISYPIIRTVRNSTEDITHSRHNYPYIEASDSESKRKYVTGIVDTWGPAMRKPVTEVTSLSDSTHHFFVHCEVQLEFFGIVNEFHKLIQVSHDCNSLSFKCNCRQRNVSQPSMFKYPSTNPNDLLLIAQKKENKCKLCSEKTTPTTLTFFALGIKKKLLIYVIYFKIRIC